MANDEMNNPLIEDCDSTEVAVVEADEVEVVESTELEVVDRFDPIECIHEGDIQLIEEAGLSTWSDDISNMDYRTVLGSNWIINFAGRVLTSGEGSYDYGMVQEESGIYPVYNINTFVAKLVKVFIPKRIHYPKYEEAGIDLVSYMVGNYEEDDNYVIANYVEEVYNYICEKVEEFKSFKHFDPKFTVLFDVPVACYWLDPNDKHRLSLADVHSTRVAMKELGEQDVITFTYPKEFHERVTPELMTMIAGVYYGEHVNMAYVQTEGYVMFTDKTEALFTELGTQIAYALFKSQHYYLRTRNMNKLTEAVVGFADGVANTVRAAGKVVSAVSNTVKGTIKGAQGLGDKVARRGEEATKEFDESARLIEAAKRDIAAIDKLYPTSNAKFESKLRTLSDCNVNVSLMMPIEMIVAADKIDNELLVQAVDMIGTSIPLNLDEYTAKLSELLLSGASISEMLHVLQPMVNKVVEKPSTLVFIASSHPDVALELVSLARTFENINGAVAEQLVTEMAIGFINIGREDELREICKMHMSGIDDEPNKYIRGISLFK